jgi:hypothetical protein
MNKENLSFLQGNLKYLGFGENMLINEQLELLVEQQPNEIILFTEAYFDEHHKVEATLYFRRSSHSDMYFFNKYDARLIHDEDPAKNREQIFYINKGSGITFKESYNLLLGRSVYKKLTDRDGKEYYAWVKLNFEEKEENYNYKVQKFGLRYGFDLEKTLSIYPIMELKSPDQKASLIRALQRGNQQLVTLEKTNKMEKMYIEANPQYKTINLYPTGIHSSQRMVKHKELSAMEEFENKPEEQYAFELEEAKSGDPEEPNDEEKERIRKRIPARKGSRKLI